MSIISEPNSIISFILWGIVAAMIFIAIIAMSAPAFLPALREIIANSNPLYVFDDYRDLSHDQVKRIRHVKHILDDMDAVWKDLPDGVIYVGADGSLFHFADGNKMHKSVPFMVSDVQLNDIVEYLVFEVEEGIVRLPVWMD